MDFVAHPKATYQSRNGLLSPFATWLHGWDSSGRCWDAPVTQLPSLYPHCQLSHSPSKTNGTKKCVNIFLQHRKFKGSARLFREPRGIRPFSQPSSEHQRLAFPSAETSPSQEGGRRKRGDTGLRERLEVPVLLWPGRRTRLCSLPTWENTGLGCVSRFEQAHVNHLS